MQRNATPVIGGRNIIGGGNLHASSRMQQQKYHSLHSDNPAFSQPVAGLPVRDVFP
jgi:hypothetical protein